MEEQVLDIEGINITFFRSQKAKSLNITIKPFTGVRVSVPRFVSFKKAKEVAQQRIGWIKLNLSRMQKSEDLFTVFDYDTQFKTRSHHLQMKESSDNDLHSSVRNNTIAVDIPKGMKVHDKSVQLEVRRAIERAWLKEGKGYLPERVKYLADKHNCEYSKVTVRNSKTRWGSCSVDNNINLSLHLMRLPDHLVDYVILHELTHTKVKNHSKDFWQLLDQVSGKAKKLDQEVKQNGIQIY